IAEVDIGLEIAHVLSEDGGVAAVVESVVHHLAKGRVVVDVGHPTLETHGADYSWPVRVTATVSAKPLRELNVWSTAVASYPQWTMQSRHFSLPLFLP